jgi:ABC-type uncharacterized transport system permease subunit
VNWPVVLEKRSDPAPRLRYVLPAVAIGIGLLLGAMVLSFMGAHPGEAYQEMARGAFGSVYGLSETLVKATPLLLASLGVGVAFRAGFWNIGAEGQLYMGAMGGTWMALTYPDLPAPPAPTLDDRRGMFGRCVLGAYSGRAPNSLVCE